jgi:DNA mismatch repair protein MutH
VIAPPTTEAQLVARARAMAGRALGEVAEELGLPAPGTPVGAKGWAGQLVERLLGASAGSLPEPDFQRIGVELKTIPVGADGRPRESTYVCVVPLDDAGSPHWAESNVRRKLARVLWVPVEAGPDIPIVARRLGSALLWSPDSEQESALRADWEELMDLVCLGRVGEISARQGTCLQIRPKAADSRARRWGTDETGERIRTLPRGFYLRASFTAAVLARHYALR